MKIPRLRLLGVTALALAFAAPPVSAQTGEDIFQSALVLERSNGEVREAIQLYERIVRDFASDRHLVARALVRLGMAHEALGSLEARAAYERVVNDFADQAELATQARARLAALAEEATDPSAEQVSRMLFTDAEGCAVYWMRASRDGKRVAWSDICGDGSLMIRDLSSGETRQLAQGGWHSVPLWSRDGSRILAMRRGQGIRVYDVETGADRTPAGAREVRANPVDWNADGVHLAAVATDADGTTSPVVVSMADGTSLRLAEDLHQGANVARFSPDGRSVVFMDYVGDDLELFVSALDGSGRARLSNSGSEAVANPLWAPDGRMIIYQQAETWRAVRMAAGVPTGQPFPVRAEASHWPIDWTESGLLHVEENIIAEATELLVDPATGMATGSEIPLPAALQRGALWMAWSPAKSHMATADWDNVLRIYSASSGALTEYPMGPEFLPSHLWWSADGGEVRFTTAARARRDKRSTVFGLNPSDGSVRELFPRLEDVHHLHVSSDGQKMTFITNLLSRGGDKQIIVSDVGSRNGVVVDSAPGAEGNLSGRYGQPVFSPDGSYVLYLRSKGAPGEEGGYVSTIWLAASDGSSPPRPLASKANGFHVGFVWSPDGRFVAFTEVDMESEEGTLSVVSVQTGERIDLLSSLQFSRGGAEGGLSLKYWSPDGRAIGVVRSTGKMEVWLTRDILGADAPGGDP